ncbi:kelch repeat-containing protein [Myxococcus faecalis]|uniref:Kelch repeat-containing protein n=1 Tax=Myxococcus faecalis TaxID=3115646 RepID=UPI003CE79EB1
MATQQASLSTPQTPVLVRTSATQTALTDGRVLLAGGTTNGSTGGTRHAEVFTYASPNTTWQATGQLNVGRYDHAATRLQDGRVLVSGGITTNGDWTSAELYNPTSGQWTTVAAMSTARARHTQTLLGNGKVLVVGGVNPTTTQGLASAEIFDPATGTWTATAAPSFAYSSHSATPLPDGRVLVLGNRKEHELYNPSTNTWARTADSPSTISAGHTATVRTRSYVDVVVVGATWNNAGATPIGYQYLPNTNVWNNVSAPTVPRKGHQAVKLGNGAVRIVGGVHPTLGTPITTVERYNTNANWYTEPLLGQGRRDVQATLVGTSDPMLVNGGWTAPTDGGTPARLAPELYSGCVAKTACGAGQCNLISDNCGGSIDCGTNCPIGQSCDWMTNQCKPECTPIDLCWLQSRCGIQPADTCGTTTVDCGPCTLNCPPGKVECCGGCYDDSQCNSVC